MIDLHKDLNEEQRAAAGAPDGPVLVLAAAGTGKTRTLVYRVAHLVERGVPPERILLLTFTNRAAREMLDRARTLVGPGIGGIWGGTFHHMANRILRKHAPLLDHKHSFTILDQDDARSLVGRCVRDLGLQSKEFPKKEVLLSLFATVANTELPLAQAVEQRYGDGPADAADIARVYDEYGKKKRQLDAMDFDDLLVNCLRLFRDHPRVREIYQEHFLHVLVDEYQDTNAIQAELVDWIVKKRRNVLVVGDDFQSIYGWRGANYRNILSFPTRYEDARVFKLETNYRSVPEVLDVANACIAGNPAQFQKCLRPTRPPRRKPRVITVRDGADQARHVLHEIRSLHRSGCRYSDIAVLYRAHFHAMDVQMQLTRQRIPHVITSGVRFFEQAHIKDVCSVLRVLASPTDEVAFTRLLCMLPGAGEKTAEKIWRDLGGWFDPRSEEKRQTVRRGLKAGAAVEWARVEEVLVAYRASNDELTAGETVYRFVKAFYRRYALDTFENAKHRLDDVEELVRHTTDYESTRDFLADVALLTNLDAEQGPEGVAEDSVRLSTVHQAKGLEWPVVILLWMTEGMFPSSRTLEDDPLEGEAEERRLFYVAVTRAKDDLYLFVPEWRQGRGDAWSSAWPAEPSRFIREIPAAMVDAQWPE